MMKSLDWRSVLVLLVVVGGTFSVALLEPIPQDPEYHVFADQRPFAGIPNFLNVVSNLPFLVFGVLGWRTAYRDRAVIGSAERPAWLIFFGGIALTALGSAWFHWEPNNSTLIWDRLPMTIAFMSLVAIILTTYLWPVMGPRLLLPLLLIGAASVAWWAYTESIGAGDLRPYALVQFLPMLLILLILSISRYSSYLSVYIGLIIVVYVAAKAAEYFDAQLLALGNIVSGHSLKHVLAALAPACLWVGLLRRQANLEHTRKQPE